MAAARTFSQSISYEACLDSQLFLVDLSIECGFVTLILFLVPGRNRNSNDVFIDQLFKEGAYFRNRWTFGHEYSRARHFPLCIDLCVI